MKKIKVSEASGLVLDWLVAKCEGLQPSDLYISKAYYETPSQWVLYHRLKDDDGKYTNRVRTGPDLMYSRRWEAGGPIIEREKININGGVGWAPGSQEFGPYFRAWQGAYHDDPDGAEFGPTPLIAAMRCYVVSKLGDTAEVPEELLK